MLLGGTPLLTADLRAADAGMIVGTSTRSLTSFQSMTMSSGGTMRRLLRSTKWHAFIARYAMERINGPEI